MLMMRSNRAPKVIDLFCGAGGLSLGLQRAGFDVLYALDNDVDAIATYNLNLGDHGHVGDVRALSKSSLALSGIDTDCVDLIAGGPPCQGFSVQRRGSDHDERNFLVLEFLRLVLEIKPKFFLMENVSGLLSVRGKAFMDRFCGDCASEGYEVKIQKLHAVDYGVPQNRKRAFLIGRLKSASSVEFEFPRATQRYVDSPVTVRDAMADLLYLSESQLANHKADRLSPINLARIRSIKAGQGRDSLPEELQLACHRNNKSHRHLDTYGRMSWDEPAPTITARFDSFSRGRFGHPELDRTITLREGARLQTFPDSFEFIGTKVSVARQIGNAVPPTLGRVVGESIISCIHSECKVVA